MNVKELSQCLGLLATVLVLIGCQQPQHSFSLDSAEQASVAVEDIAAPSVPVTLVAPLPIVSPTTTTMPPTAPPAPFANVPQGVSTLCTAFMMKPGPIDLTATENLNIDHLYMEETFARPLGTINVNSTSGGLNIQSAVLAQNISVVSGEVRINAQTIDFAKSTTGSLCLRADRIGTVIAEGNPVQTLIANRIDSLSIHGSGVVHIFNAQVARIKGPVVLANLICLHDGAKILDLGGNNPNIVNPNCR